MAKQDGIVPLKGTLDNITFYKTKDGYVARKKNSIDAKRIATDPAFQRTRENLAEFGRAGKAGKVLRNALRSLMQNTADGRMIARLTKEMMKVIKADATSDRGFRNVIDGEATLLKGFEFNANSLLTTTMYATYTATVDRASGELVVNIASFVPTDQVKIPAGATHFKIISAGVEIDFEKGNHTVNSRSSEILKWDSTPTSDLVLRNTVTPNSTHPLFIVLGIELYQEVNGKNYPLKNGAFNALAIVEVQGV